MSGFLSTPIIARTDWGAGLMTVTVEAHGDFIPGQFFNLGLSREDVLVRRSYSAASAPGEPLQFLLSQVESGMLTPSLFQLQVGAKLLLDPTALGFFTLDEVPKTRRLWLVATGTGLGPYLSMLRAGALDERFEQINIVHGVRKKAQLAHRNELIAATESSAHLRYLPVVSGDVDDVDRTNPTLEEGQFLPGRITKVWDSGELESLLGAFDQDCHMLLCGNPQMIEHMTERLKARGFEKHRRRKAGHFNFEKYW